MNDVDEFLEALDHPLASEIETLRRIIRSAMPGISEHIKWNAPSFCFGGDDRVTMKLRPTDAVQLILHRGAKVKDTRGFSFEDDSGLVRWLAKDRGLVTFRDTKEIRAAKRPLQTLVKRWMQETTEKAPAKVSPKRKR